MSTKHLVSRREFLRLGALSSGGLLLAACGAQASPTPTPVPPTATTAAELVAAVGETTEERIIVGDVLDYLLTSDEWPGAFGSVTFRLHEGRYNGEPIYFIRTDTSEPVFAEQNKLVLVPLLAAGRDVAAPLYIFDDDRLPVFSRTPGEDNFTSLFQIKRVTVNDDSLALESAEAVEQAAADGQVTIEEEISEGRSVFVNYPIVKWPGGELSVDEEKAEYLGTGQLVAPVNTGDMTVTFKLHECFPGSRYIVTDTSIAAMAPMMSVPASPPNEQLMESGATDEIWVFANGIPGSGVMGFQPTIFDNQAGQPIWSPFWNHFTLRWQDESAARVLRSSDEVRAALEAGEVEEFNGTPDSHPTGFVVNCPVPVLAANTFNA